MEYDVFISHASEDKRDIVDPLVHALEEAKITCWYDKQQIHWGDGITKSINEGLQRARYVIAVISASFVHKGWPLSELHAFLNEQVSSGKTRVLPLLVGRDEEIGDMLSKLPLLKDRKYLRWAEGVDVVVNSMLARLSRLQPPMDNRSQMFKQQSVRCKFTAVVFAAGKSTRMEGITTKMLLQVSYLGKTQAMLFHVVDLFEALEIPVLVLVGFAGSTVMKKLQEHYGANCPKIIRVAQDSGEDLMSNTAGTLRRYGDEILSRTSESDYLLFTVGDQPYMRGDSINEFILDLLERSYQAGILLADATGTELEKSASTRVSITGDHKISFFTPTKESRWELQSNLLDVGVLVLHRNLFREAASRIPDGLVFSRLLEYLPKEQETFLAKKERDVLQFRNVNSITDVPVDAHIEATAPNAAMLTDASRMLLDWLRWNLAGRPDKGNTFSVFKYGRQFPVYCEVDTTTECSGTLGCTLHCTYRDKHTKGVVLDYDLGRYFLDKACDLGVRGILFSGGGENLEACAYDRFLSLLKYAKRDKGLDTILATNARFLSFDRMQEISLYLDSMRISIPPNRGDYCHAGLVAPSVTALRKVVLSHIVLGAGRDNTMKIIANILMSPQMPQNELEALIRMFSQMGVDGIRLKPMHEFQDDGSFKVRPTAYARHIETIHTLISDDRLRLPEVSVAKIHGMLSLEITPRLQPQYCWYRDFNPLVLGADGHLYACCEMKYEKRPFDKGQLLHKEDNLSDLLGVQKTPHPIMKANCFKGCKGYLPNNDLQLLLDKYGELTESIFEDCEAIAARNRVLASLPRTVLGN